jgi:hypothetical protein
MTLASVSMILPLQNGHTVGRVTASADCLSRMLFNPFSGEQGVPMDADCQPSRTMIASRSAWRILALF